MRYLYYFSALLVVVAGLYNLSGIVYLKWIYFQIENPKATFQKVQDGNQTLVTFTNYSCGNCKKMKMVDENLDVFSNIAYVVRPILLPTNEERAKAQPIALEKLSVAAGLQGKFVEMHNFFISYPAAIIPEDIIRETAELYGVDYAQLTQDAQGEKVAEYLSDNIRDLRLLNIQTIPNYVVGKNIYTVRGAVPSLQEFRSFVTQSQ